MESFTEHAYRLDEQDPLAGFRDRFVIEDDYIYLDGNSLGRLPIDTTFSEVSRAAEITREIVVSRSYESYPAARTGVT